MMMNQTVKKSMNQETQYSTLQIDDCKHTLAHTHTHTHIHTQIHMHEHICKFVKVREEIDDKGLHVQSYVTVTVTVTARVTYQWAIRHEVSLPSVEPIARRSI